MYILVADGSIDSETINVLGDVYSLLDVTR